MRNFVLLFTLLLMPCLSACATASAETETKVPVHAHDEPTPYNASADAQADVTTTLAAAKAEKKLGLLVFGANWCHDSRALAAHFEKPRFETMIRSHFKLVYVDVGQKNRNIDLARNFGVDNIVGTPTVFVTDSEGTVLNLDTAPTWRNAATRHEDAVWEYFREFAHPKT